MLLAKSILKLLSCLFVVAACVTAAPNVPILEFEVIDDALETEPRELNLLRVTPPEGLVISNIDLFNQTRKYVGESTAADLTPLPHSEYRSKSKKTRRTRQASLRAKKSPELEEANNVSNKLSTDYGIPENDGSGDEQQNIAFAPEIPRIQQSEIYLTPESGYSPSSTVPKTKKISPVIEQTKTIESFSSADSGRDSMDAISAEDRESFDSDVSLSKTTVEDPPMEETVESLFETDLFNGEARMVAEDQEYSSDKLEKSQQPNSLILSGRTVEASGISTYLVNSATRTEDSITKDVSRVSKKLTTIPTRSVPSKDGTTFPLFGDNDLVRVLKENIAVMIGVILGLPVFVTICYLLNHRRSRTGSMDITPATSVSGNQKMSSTNNSSTLTYKTENELATCPCEASST